MLRRQTARTQLVEIQTSTFKAGNPYRLSDYELNHLRIVLNTFIHLIDNMDELRDRNEVYDTDPENRAAIHFEDYGVIEYGRARNEYGLMADTRRVIIKYYGEDCENFLFQSLIHTFTQSFKNVQDAGGTHLNIYCQKLAGYCIDLRTQAAFEYGLRFGTSVPFNDHLSMCFSKLPPNLHGSYCWVVASIVNNVWDKQFLPDAGKNAIIKRRGRINETAFGIPRFSALIDGEQKEEKDDDEKFGAINRFLKMVMQPNGDFLNAYKSVKTDLREIYFQLILAQPEILEKSLFVPKIDLDTFKSEKEKTQFKAQRNFAQSRFDQFMSENMNTLIMMLDKGSLSKEVMARLIATTSASALLDLWQSKEFILPRSSLKNSDQTLQTIASSMLTRMQSNQNTLKTLFSTYNAEGLTFMHLVIESNNAPLIKSAKVEADKLHINTQAPAKDGLSLMAHAAQLHKFVSVESLLPDNRLDEKDSASPSTELGTVLLQAAEGKNWNLVNTLIDIQIIIHEQNKNGEDTLALATLDNQTEVITHLLEMKADINQASSLGVTPLVRASSANHTVTLDTLYFVMCQENLDLSKHNQGVKALLAACDSETPDKLLLLLTRPEIDFTAAANKATRTNGRQYPILILYSLIKHLLDDNIIATENTAFLSQISQADINKVLGTILSLQSYPNDTVNQVKFTLRNAMHYKQLLPQEPAALFQLSGQHFETSLSAVNKLMLFAHSSTEANSWAWQGSIRQEATTQLNREINTQNNLTAKKKILGQVRSEPVFSLQRSTALGRTGAQIAIDTQLTTLNNEAERNADAQNMNRHG